MRTEVLPFLLAIWLLACKIEGNKCPPSSCGAITNISYPFRLDSYPAECWHGQDNHYSDDTIQLHCQGNQTLLYIENHLPYYVQQISYASQEILLIDLNLMRNNCSSLPPDSFSSGSGYFTFAPLSGGYVTFVSCRSSVDNPLYIPSATPCSISNSTTSSFIYLLLGPSTLSDLDFACQVLGFVPFQRKRLGGRNHTYPEIHRVLLMGFRWQWTGYFLIARTSVGFICLAVYLIYKWRKRHLSMDESIEAFLSDYKSHIPKRYTYWSIRWMTDWFKEKLGQGGFGSVYKGKLPNGQLVAVKILGKAKGNVQDFINEVATIGRIHHVNIVQLIGFCSEGSKRALIYDFMPNGSLDKHIFSQEGTASSLSWEKLHEIVLGIARGIEYLHKGCDMQILHFDIKPHNILLDKDFIPKVSDFGLAKFYSRDDSIASMTDARGTLGYMAPELFYGNVGRVSYKSDVYSFGMLLLEIAGKRKNLNAHAEKSSQIYFPSWIYDRLEQGGNVEFEDATEEEKAMAKKLVVIALWCIQMRPSDRPSMSKVVEMLEGTGGDLEMPPKPFVSSPGRVLEEDLKFFESSSSNI
ncbi:hypothetical protein ACLOJK_039131 [Asimina triloba]